MNEADRGWHWGMDFLFGHGWTPLVTIAVLIVVALAVVAFIRR